MYEYLLLLVFEAPFIQTDKENTAKPCGSHVSDPISNYKHPAGIMPSAPRPRLSARLTQHPDEWVKQTQSGNNASPAHPTHLNLCTRNKMIHQSQPNQQELYPPNLHSCCCFLGACPCAISNMLRGISPEKLALSQRQCQPVSPSCEASIQKEAATFPAKCVKYMSRRPW